MAAVIGWLYLPLAVWAAAGIGLLLSFRGPGTTRVLRFAAVFLGLWALLATTVLVWVLYNGGWDAVGRLAGDPALLFQPRFLGDWILGALGAFAVLAGAFTLNQLVGQGWLRTLNARPIPWPARLPRPRTRSFLGSYPSARPDAFSFTLLRHAHGGGLRWEREEVILVSDGLRERLTPDELEATIAHELGHLGALDGRYLTYLRTLSRLVRWDPVLAYLSSSLTRREEWEADRRAVELTGSPDALARAIRKASAGELPWTGHPVPVRGLLGRAGFRHRDATSERLRRLASEPGPVGPEARLAR
jgi:Zn-dependent protease with chaperone function